MTESAPLEGGFASAAKKLDHVVLQIGQLFAMWDWYLSVLDAHIVDEDRFVSMMTFDEEHPPPRDRAAVASRPRSALAVGLAQSAYTFGSLADLLAYEDLKTVGIEPMCRCSTDQTTSLYYCDPDGNKVELQIDNFATPEETTECLRSEEFQTDPFGPSFDCSLCWSRYASARRNPSLGEGQSAMRRTGVVGDLETARNAGNAVPFGRLPSAYRAPA